MDEQMRRFSPTVVGGSSLLVIFAVLCLTVFALLSLSTARADARLSAANAAATTNYYEADRQAEAIFARLRSGDRPEGVTIRGDEYSYSCPITAQQTLQVTLKLDAEGWTILQWQAVSTGDWEPESGPGVWDGEGG